MKYRLSALFLAGILVLFLMAGCGSIPAETASSSADSSKKLTATIFAMDTVMDLTIYGGSQEVLDTACNRINNLEALLSTTDRRSEIYALNQDGTANLSDDASGLLGRGLELCQETDGTLDLSIYPIVKAWGFTTGEYRIPEEDTINSLLAHVDYTAISLKDGSASIPKGMAIDLGSIAKGYTGDVITAYFRSCGVTSALLNLGGNVHALGTKPDGTNWRVGVQDPSGESYLGALEIADRAVITSGGYERYFTDDAGNIYWHIMNPFTGHPAKSGLISVTIVGPEGARCDALSTALFVKGEADAIAFWQEHRDFEMLLVTEDGRILITPDLYTCFTPAEQLNYEIEVIPC